LVLRSRQLASGATDESVCVLLMLRCLVCSEWGCLEMLLHLALRWGGQYLQYFCDSNFTILRVLGDRPNRQPNQLIYFVYDEPGCSEIKLFTLVQLKPAELNQDPNSPKLTPRFRGSEIHPVIHGKLARQISWAN
jgi:hypothetical protein